MSALGPDVLAEMNAILQRTARLTANLDTLKAEFGVIVDDCAALHERLKNDAASHPAVVEQIGLLVDSLKANLASLTGSLQ